MDANYLLCGRLSLTRRTHPFTTCSPRWTNNINALAKTADSGDFRG